MSTKRCQHTEAADIIVCKHIYNRTSTDGIKRFSGEGTRAEYICKRCAEKKLFAPHYLCKGCIKQREEDGWFRREGKPGIRCRTEPFQFTRREFTTNLFNGSRILAFAPLHGSSAAVVFDADGRLLQIDLKTQASRLVAEYRHELIRRDGAIRLLVSPDNCYAAITSLVYRGEDYTGNKGVVVELAAGRRVLNLDCGDYHTEHTLFPVAFVEQAGRMLVIHATDWNRLDITDLESRVCLTERDMEELPERDNESLFTEWYGELCISPDRQRIATIGWMWHPVGVAFSWDLQTWLTENVWEADIGLSKKSYAIWDYFWDSPFFWLDNRHLCIWGLEDLQAANDIPLDSVAVYDACTEELLDWFPGPTMDTFIYDEWLFSGSREQDDTLTVWSVADGTLLHTEPGINPNTYHPVTREFVRFTEEGTMELHHWEKI
ncbi:MAG: hypothetical protein OEZ39_16120 [Gammaproteobacteria bacterium]|nr:hypothetical protein [Gammaproteobacteria bacterium]